MGLRRDSIHAVRSWVKQPMLAGLAMLMLIIGTAAGTTVFTLLNGILLRPLPYEDPNRLVLLDETAHARGVPSMGVSFPNFLDWKEQNQVFEGIAAYQSGEMTLSGVADPERIPVAAISWDLFSVLGILPELGRTFLAEEDVPEQDDVVVLSHSLWQSRFGADRGALSRRVLLNGRPHTVVGVMKPGFRFPETAQAWVPLGLDTTRWTRTDHGLTAIARLRAGTSLAQAQAEMDLIARRIEDAHPVTNDGLGVAVHRLRDRLTGDYQQALYLLFAAVAMVVAISCANVIGLLLVRASQRRGEIALRTTLGAGKPQILRLLLAEGMVPVVPAGVLGLALSSILIKVLLSRIPVELPFWMTFSLDFRVLLFVAAGTLLTGVLCGLAPLRQAFRSDLIGAMKGSRGDWQRGPAQQRFQRLLIAGQVALTTLVLVGAGLMTKSFAQLTGVDPGFRSEGILTMRVALPSSRYAAGERTATFHRFREAIEGLPGISSASYVSNLPLSGGAWGRSLTIEGRPVLGVSEAPMINHRVALPGYFRTMGIPLLRGRDFQTADTSEGTRVAVINESLAREFFPAEDPLAKRIRLGPPENEEPWHTIIGVVGDVRHDGLDSTARRGVYIPHGQLPLSSLQLVVSASGDWRGTLAAVRSTIRAMDAELPLAQISSMEEIKARSIWRPYLYSFLFRIFALTAALLAAVGIYGVTSYWVSLRLHEMGIRRALGAVSGDVLRVVLLQNLRIVAAGLILGLAASLPAARSFSGLLFEVRPYDPWVLIGATSLLMLVAGLAAAIPARRACRVDPASALRTD